MESPEEKLARLFQQPELTEEERRWLLWYLENTDKQELRDLMFVDFNRRLQETDREDGPTPSPVILGRIHERIGQPRPGIKWSLPRWSRLAAAACVAGLIVTGSWLWFTAGKTSNNTEIARIQNTRTQSSRDILPGSNKAVLTLSDGSDISLDDAADGNLTKQGNTSVTKNNGSLTYSQQKAAAASMVFNRLATPRGGQFQLTLPDGSQVWLNAESSIRFPTAFTENERRVEVTGEVYFEVAKNALKPFIVQVRESEVRVLGTHFNIMAYNSEAYLKTTLLEGSVQFVNSGRSSQLSPGQQSQLNGSGQVKVTDDVNVEEEIAWKNGSFHFEHAGIESVMHQLERWYDVEVEYRNLPPLELFHADIPRNTNLSVALKALELTGKVHFSIEGKKIIVMP